MSNIGIGLAALLYGIWLYRSGRLHIIGEAMSGKATIS